MKKLFKFLVFAGVIGCVVVVAVGASRRRASGPGGRATPWETPTVEAPPETATRVRDSEYEGMTPAPEDAPVDAAVSATGEAVVSELAAPGAAEKLLAAEDASIAAEDAVLEEQLSVAEDEGMGPPPASPEEDVAISSTGEPVVSGLATPDTDIASLDAEAALVEALEESEAQELAAAAESPLDTALHESPAEPEPESPNLEALLDEAEAQGRASDEQETTLLTRAFEDLAATPEAAEEAMGAPGAPPPISPLEAEPEVRADESLLSSVEEALGDLEPAQIFPPPRRTAESYLDEGNVYFNVGQYGLAIERYGQAIALDADLTAAFYNRANAHTRAGDFEKALADYDRALELQPLDADALNNRGMLHLYRANYSNALGDFNRALDMDPRDTTVMVNRGLAQLHSGNAAAALVDFREAAAMDDRDAAAQYGAAQAAATMGNREEALRHVGRALELDAGYAREAAADPRLAILAGDDEFMKMLRESGTRSSS